MSLLHVLVIKQESHCFRDVFGQILDPKHALNLKLTEL